MNQLGTQILRYWPTAILGVMALLNIARGCIHLFAEDGGAGSIAGLDLQTNQQTILALFAIIGAQQLTLGVLYAWVLAFARSLIPAALVLQTCITLTAQANLYLYRNFPVEVPGKLFNSFILLLLVATLVILVINSKRRSESP